MSEGARGDGALPKERRYQRRSLCGGRDRFMATTLTCDPPPDRKHAVSLMRIGPAQCRFIISEPAKKPIFCGAPTNGCSWCAWHRGIVYRDQSSQVIS